MPNVELNEQPLKEFQLTTDTKSKLSEEFGKQISKYICGTTFGVQSYYWLRNERFLRNRNWANGRIDVQRMFQDRLEFDGKVNYVNLSWKAIMMVNTIVSKMVGRWMQRKEKIQVTATDPYSVDEKEKQYKLAEFIMFHRQEMEQLEQEAGVPLVPKDQFVPEDQTELDLWTRLYQHLPEEILYEMGCNQVLTANGWFDVLKQKMLRDSAEVGLVGTYTCMDEQGNIRVEWVRPENMIYSYTEYPDFRDTTWRGQVKSMKISEIRKRYGQEFGGKLSEEELFEIASQSKDYQLGDKIRWNQQWVLAYLRPYDEYNVDVIDFEFRSLDKESRTKTVTKKNQSTILRKGRPQKLDENQEVLEDKDWNIYRGVYIKDIDVLLEWGLKKNMIRPQDPKEIGNVEFSYSFYMYDPYNMRNIAVPEKIEEPVEQMLLIRLKIQQLIAKMRPTGVAINWDAVQELDLGMGDGDEPVDAEKMYDQTGRLYYRGRDGAGNPIPVPITELQNAGFISQMQGLIALYQQNQQVLKEELGEDPNLISQATKPRVAASNVQASMVESDNSTSHMYDAYLWCMRDTAKKISCLLKNSVTYGATVYRSLLKEEDIKGRRFSTNIEMLPTEIEIAKLEGFMNESLAANPDLILYLDPFKIMRIAKEDVKLAEMFLRQAQKKALQSRMQQAKEQSEYNGKIQIESAQAKAQADAELAQLEAQIESAKVSAEGKSKKEEIVLQGLFDMYKTGAPLPPEVQSLAAQLFQSIVVPLIGDNIQNQAQLQQGLQQMQQTEAENEGEEVSSQLQEAV